MMLTEEQLNAAAEAMRTEAMRFASPADLYIAPEGSARSGDYPDPFDQEEAHAALQLEGYRILIRAALAVI